MNPISFVRNPKPAVLLAALVGLTALAGCLGSADELSQNLAPVAVLDVDRAERWSGEKFSFNASASHDPDGEVTRLFFDFGDGNEFEVEDPANASAVEHAYQTGGVYAVTLTVTDDGANDTGMATHTTSLLVVVHERQEISTQVNYAAPNADANASKSTHTFVAGDQAASYEADLQVRGMLPVGSSSVTLRVLNETGAVLEEETVTVEATGNTTVHLKGALSAGNHTIEMVVTSGGAAVGGTLRLYYENATIID